jgi:PAS domain S-box-containing protein
MTGFDISSAAASGGLFAHLMGAAGSTAVISTDLVGRVTYCSPGAEVMLGLRGGPLLGQPMPHAMFDLSELRSRASELGVAADLGVLTARMSADRLHAGGENLLQVRDWTVTCADGTRLIASIAVYLARDTDGREVGYVGIAHDVTEKHRTNRIVADALVAGEQAVERLQELDLAKTEFISTVSHELRTPLSSIVGATEMLQDGLGGELSPTQLKLLATVDRNCERLITLADDLGTVARTDAGFLDLQLAELDLRDVVSKAREALQTVLLDRSLETFLELPPGPLIINGDRAQLARAVLNLLNNAVKFTDDGGTITCRLTRSGTDAVLEVSDNGVGIPRAEQRELFTRFFRSSASHDRETQGSGLGLSIVSSIVQQHGGQISVESDHLQGSAFTVRIPLLVPTVTDHAA